jgi:hypothetical protein
MAFVTNTYIQNSFRGIQGFVILITLIPYLLCGYVLSFFFSDMGHVTVTVTFEPPEVDDDVQLDDDDESVEAEDAPEDEDDENVPDENEAEDENDTTLDNVQQPTAPASTPIAITAVSTPTLSPETQTPALAPQWLPLTPIRDVVDQEPPGAPERPSREDAPPRELSSTFDEAASHDLDDLLRHHATYPSL